MKALILDFETGGLDYKKFSPLSIAFCVVDLDKGEILHQFSSLIKLPSYNVEPEALAVNGLSVAECQATGMTPAEIAEKLMDAWVTHQCSLLGGHNIHFDIRFLAHWIFGIEPHKIDEILTYRYLDTYPLMQLLMGTVNSPPGTSLKQAVKHLKIDLSEVKGGYHQALYDTIACAKLLIKFRGLLQNAS